MVGHQRPTYCSFIKSIAMAYVIDRVGYDSVLNGFDLHEKSVYSVWQGKTLKFYCISDDLDDAKNKLAENLNGIHNSSTAMYEIRFYETNPEKGITNATPYCGSFTFKMNNGIGNELGQVRLEPYGDASLTAYLRKENDVFKKRLDELESSLKLDGVGDIDLPEPTMFDKVIGLINDNPKLQDSVVSILSGIAGSIFGSQVVKSITNQAAIAGIEIDPNLGPQEKFLAVIDALTNASTEAEHISKVNRFSESMRRLLAIDGDLLNTLEKLSNLDQKKLEQAKLFL